MSGRCIDQAKLHASGGELYNTGFGPIIGPAKAIKKILEAWAEIHIGIIKRDFSDKIKRWVCLLCKQPAKILKLELKALTLLTIRSRNEREASHQIAHYLATKGYREGFVGEEIKKAKSDPYYKDARDVFAREKSKFEVTRFEQIKAERIVFGC
ncbi:MAG: hypothetical protein ACJA2D_000784 [Pseudohongiellaceae bacterium]